MPKVYITEADRLNAALRANIGAEMGRRGIHQYELANKVGMSGAAFSRRLKEPGKLNLDVFRQLVRVLRFSDEQILETIRCKK